MGWVVQGSEALEAGQLALATTVMEEDGADDAVRLASVGLWTNNSIMLVRLWEI